MINKRHLTLIRGAIQKILPNNIFNYLDSLWKDEFKPIINKKSRVLKKYKNIFFNIYGKKVISGPFKGMNYIDKGYGSVYLQKLIGYYELEIQKEINYFLKKKYEKFIDIGSAEGYYLVGFALFSKSKDIIGYDISDEAINLSKKLASNNDVLNKIKLKNNCTYEDLNNEIKEPTLILSDNEGFEGTILNPLKVPKLKLCDIIVETHDFDFPNVTSILKERFKKTHDIKEINVENNYPIKKILNFPFIKKIDKKDMLYFLEARGRKQTYLILTRKINNKS
jgi:hypothetical protein